MKHKKSEIVVGQSQGLENATVRGTSLVRRDSLDSSYLFTVREENSSFEESGLSPILIRPAIGLAY